MKKQNMKRFIQTFMFVLLMFSIGNISDTFASNFTQSYARSVMHSRKTKIYSGTWYGSSVTVYIRWEKYSREGYAVDGVVLSKRTGDIIEIFSGNNDAFRQMRVSLSDGSSIRLRAKVSRRSSRVRWKTWRASGIRFSRRFP
ncbi:hypothetical protein TI05_10465 [Achromatium sp. WMS3]|nr:hypothetical protein TI05_10465 [Achromatium sp. WMS3]